MALVGALAKGTINFPKKLFCIALEPLPIIPVKFSVKSALLPATESSSATDSGSSKTIKALSFAVTSSAPFILLIRPAFTACSYKAPRSTIRRQKSSVDCNPAPGILIAFPI